jgi:1-aminocyclopropane-1-carboxylate deaminase
MDLLSCDYIMIYHPTPVNRLKIPELEHAGIEIFVKREDLNHPFISGNKWWKLKYNLQKAIELNFKTVLTFGGAYSNHIYATAAASHELGLQSIGIIRGERTSPLNSTLHFAESKGMHLHYITRESYREKDQLVFIKRIEREFGKFYLIPEGGTNALAVTGCSELATTQLATQDFDHLFLPVGTGGTMAGLVCGFKGEKKITGIAVLKGGEFLEHDIRKLIENNSAKDYGNWRLLTSYHHGGYAKVSNELERFIVKMRIEHNLPLDHVYTGKLVWAVVQEALAGNFKKGEKILILHTGGLQGAR